jgi:Fe-S-cluster containining protein
MFDNEKVCAACGGECCKRFPGSAFPEDFGLPEDTSRIREALKSGRWCIDWWEGDSTGKREGAWRTLFVRPAIKGKEGRIYDPSWGGECTFLTNSGCSIDSDHRPLGCKKLEPKGGGCILHDNADKKASSIAWVKYEALLLEIGDIP